MSLYTATNLPTDGETIDAADVNTDMQGLIDEFNGGIDNDNIADGANIAWTKLASTSWEDFTPAIAVSGGTAPTYTATFTSKYMQLGKLVWVMIDWRNASGGTAGDGTGQITFTPPVPAANVGMRIPAGISLNSTADEKRVVVSINSASVFALNEAIANNLTGAEQNNAVRYIQLNFFYEAA